MKRTLIRCLAAVILLAAAAPAPAAPASSNGIAVVVNGRPILKSEVEDLMKASEMDLRRRATSLEEFNTERAKLRAKVVDQLIDQELVLKEFEPFAATAGGRVDATANEMIRKQFVDGMFKGDRKKFLSELAAAGISYKKFFEQQRKNMIVEMMRGQFARPDSPYITEEEKAAYLAKNSSQFRVGGKLKFWSITIPGVADGKTPQDQLALAKEVRTSLVNGADFASLARTHSADSKSTDGGSWGWVEQKDLAEPFWPIVSKLGTGKVSDVVPLGGSYYIFWVEARSEGQMKPKEEVEAEVEKRVLMEKRQKAYEEWLKKLRKKASIVYK